jgi:hypothetical protein
MSTGNPSSNLENLSGQQLKAASWYVSHKVLLKKILIAALGTASIVLLGYGLYGLVNYYFIEGPKFEAALRELTEQGSLEAIRNKLQPESLSLGQTSIISGGKEKYDFVAKISNTNSSWRVEFDYNFVVDGQPLLPKSGFLLPNEEKFLLNLAVDSKVKPRRAEIEIDNLRWQRIDPHEIPDYSAWRDERFNFVFEDVKFSPAVVRDKITISRASFSVKNATSYGFWNVGFYILLYRGSSIAGVTYVTISELGSGQTRPVEVSWFEPLPSVTQVKIFPEVNIFDEKVYMPVN